MPGGARGPAIRVCLRFLLNDFTVLPVLINSLFSLLFLLSFTQRLDSRPAVNQDGVDTGAANVLNEEEDEDILF